VSFYNINESNNVFVYNSVPYTVTPGNYSATQLITALQTLIPALTITLNRVTNKFVFTQATSFTIGGVASSMSVSLGFLAGIVYTGATITSVNCCNLAGPSRLQICTNLLVENFDSSGGNTNILMTIPVTAVPGSFIYHNELVDNDMILKNPSITSIDVDVKDENGNLLNFNGVDLLFHFQLDELIEFSRPSAFDFSNDEDGNESKKN
jgi:hypothetical protein